MRMTLRFGTVWLLVGMVGALHGCGDDDAASAGNGGVSFNAPDNPFPCLDPTPVGDDRPGIVQCANGMLVNPAPFDCGPSAHAASDECRLPSDCAEGACYCARAGVLTFNTCGPRLLDSDCSSDLDCVRGFHCVLYSAGVSDWVMQRQRCQQPVDECAVDDHCPPDDRDAGYYYGPLCQDDSQGRVCCDPNNNWSCARGN